MLKIELSAKRKAARAEFLGRIVDRARAQGAIRLEPLKQGGFNISLGDFITRMGDHGLSVAVEPDGGMIVAEPQQPAK